MATKRTRPGASEKVIPPTPDEFLVEYESLRPTYVRFEDKVERLVGDLVEDLGVRVHSVTGRVKDPKSLARKLTLKDPEYEHLADVTDLAGVRVITYFNAEVDQLRASVEAAFDIDWANSSDRRTTLQPDQFGYLSLHYVLGIGETRARLPEWRPFKTLKCELQVRSILQHAWAEIEHDLGYKSPVAVPAPVRRRFSRLAGLLELADDEFARIRADLDEYVDRLPTEAAADPSGTEIDAESMLAYIRSSELVSLYDAAVAEHQQDALEADPRASYAGSRAEDMVALGLKTLSDVDELLARVGPALVDFIDVWISTKGRSGDTKIPRGCSIWFAYLVASVEEGKVGIDRVMQKRVSGPTSRKRLESAFARVASRLPPP